MTIIVVVLLEIIGRRFPGRHVVWSPFNCNAGRVSKRTMTNMDQILEKKVAQKGNQKDNIGPECLSV